MSMNPGGRISGALHLAIQFPKIAACVAAVGLTVVSITAVPADEIARFVPLKAIEWYCKDPAKAPVPDFMKPKFNRICLCASSGPVCT